MCGLFKGGFCVSSAVDRHRFDADPGPDQKFHFDADPDFFFGKSEFLNNAPYIVTVYVFLVSVINDILYNILDSILKYFLKKYSLALHLVEMINGSARLRTRIRQYDESTTGCKTT
jgi:hypothetical protein